MTCEEEVKALILQRYGSIKAFSTAHDIPNSTLDNMFRRGFQNSTITNVFKLCHSLHISADGLAVGKIIPDSRYPSAPVSETELTPDQQNIMKLYDAAPPELQKAALAVLKSQ